MRTYLSMGSRDIIESCKSAIILLVTILSPIAIGVDLSHGSTESRLVVDLFFPMWTLNYTDRYPSDERYEWFFNPPPGLSLDLDYPLLVSVNLSMVMMLSVQVFFVITIFLYRTERVPQLILCISGTLLFILHMLVCLNLTVQLPSTPQPFFFPTISIAPSPAKMIYIPIPSIIVSWLLLERQLQLHGKR